MESKSRLVALTILLASACALHADQGWSLEVREAAAQAEFVFQGTVLLPQASTVETESTDDLLVVRIDEVISAPRTLKSLAGEQVTVKSLDASRLSRGERRVFFTRLWLLGDDVGVVEVKSFPVDGLELDKLKTEITRARTVQEDTMLKERLLEAKFVVIGTVTAIGPYESDSRPQPTEHDPQWRTAEISIEETLRGNAPASRINVVYSASRDVMWYRAPKLSEGLRAVWIAPAGQVADFDKRQIVLTDAEDVRPESEIGRIRQLLRR